MNQIEQINDNQESSSASTKKRALSIAARELEAVEALGAFLDDFVEPASIHLKRAQNLFKEVWPGTSAGELLERSGIVTTTYLEKALRVEKAVSNFGAYEDRCLDGVSGVTHDDLLWYSNLLSKLLKKGEKELGVKYSFIDFLRSAPFYLLLVFVPFLIYTVGFIYTRDPNPFKWFKTGLEMFSVQRTSQGWGALMINRSATGGVLQVGGNKYQLGFGTHADSEIDVTFRNAAKRLSGGCGVDDGNKKGGSIVCRIESGGKILWSSPLMRGGMGAASFDVDVDGLRGVVFKVTDGGDGRDFDHADWVNLSLR